MPDASPAKWHLAHTTWFFETFVLRDFVPGYALHDERFPFLFNTYYEAEGAPPCARPARDDHAAERWTRCWRIARMSMPRSPTRCPICREAARELVRLGCHHEEQHQELLLTDILHLMSENPIEPAVWPGARKVPVAMPGPIGWIEHGGGHGRDRA